MNSSSEHTTRTKRSNRADSGIDTDVTAMPVTSPSSTDTVSASAQATTCPRCNGAKENPSAAAASSKGATSCADCNGQHGYVNDKRKLVARMRRIEGQVRAITNMVESDTYCIDILTQIAASTSALKSVALILLEDHLDSCVTRAAAEGGPVADEKMDEAVAAITRLVKS